MLSVLYKKKDIFFFYVKLRHQSKTRLTLTLVIVTVISTQLFVIFRMEQNTLTGTSDC